MDIKLKVILKKKYSAIPNLNKLGLLAYSIEKKSELETYAETRKWNHWYEFRFKKTDIDTVIDLINGSISQHGTNFYKIYGKDVYSLELYMDYNWRADAYLKLNEFKYNLGVAEYIKDDKKNGN